jgi:hypothetical protein
MRGLLGVMHWIAVAVILVSGGAAAAQASQDIPETIVLDRLQELYEPVVFEHGMHAEMLDCSGCHHHLKGGTTNESCMKCHSSEAQVRDVACSNCHSPLSVTTVSREEERKNPAPLYHIDIPRLKGALHLQCVGCHRIDGGPTGCRECHEFTASGRQRFRVTE